MIIRHTMVVKSKVEINEWSSVKIKLIRVSKHGMIEKYRVINGYIEVEFEDFVSANDYYNNCSEELIK